MNRFSSSRNSGKAHDAVNSERSSSASLKAMWNWRGSRNAAAKDSSSSAIHGPSRTGA